MGEHQLRSSYRAPVGKHFRVPVIIYSTGRTGVKGVLEDLSIEGAGIIIRSSVNPPFNKGEIIDGCYISPPGQKKTFQYQVEVMQYRRKIGGGKLLGVIFTNMKDKDVQELSSLIMKCQQLEASSRKR